MSDAVRKVYDRLAPVYEDRWSHYVRATLRATIEPVRPSGRERVLDLACGTGALEDTLLSRWPGLKVVGVDLSAGMLRRATLKGLPGHAARWIQADGRRLPLSDGRFDLAFCANSFHYFAEPGRVLGEVARVLRPGGRLVLVDWCDDYLSCRLCSAWLRLTDPPFHRTYTLAGCLRLLGESGFEVESSERFRISWLWGLMRFVARRR